MNPELALALDDLILGRGVARGRHALVYQGRPVRSEFTERLAANGFRPLTVREAPIEAGERIPAFRLDGDAVDFGWIRWEIFTPRSRRKLYASEHRRNDNQEWAVQIPLASPLTVWADPNRKEQGLLLQRDTQTQLEQGFVLAGDPKRVADSIRKWSDEVGLTTISGTFYFGGMPQEMAMKNIRLFAEKVMPEFR